jgi:hypothetical protein
MSRKLYNLETLKKEKVLNLDHGRSVDVIPNNGVTRESINGGLRFFTPVVSFPFTSTLMILCFHKHSHPVSLCLQTSGLKPGGGCQCSLCFPGFPYPIEHSITSIGHTSSSL